MNKKEMNIKFLLFKWKWFILIYLITFIFAGITNKISECILFFICYCNLRYLFPKTFHHNNFYHCIFWSIIMMCSSCYITLPKNISILSYLLVACFVSYVLYLVRNYFDLEKKYSTDFTKYGLSPAMAKIAYEWKVQGMRRKEQAELHGVADSTMAQYRNDINKAIQKYNN